MKKSPAKRATRSLPSTPTAASAPERWRAEAERGDVAALSIPPATDRVRDFDIDVRFVVAVRDPAAQAWLALRIEINGRLEWTRRIAAAAPADSLDYHCRRTVGVGETLRIVASTEIGGCLRERLLVAADEIAEL